MCIMLLNRQRIGGKRQFDRQQQRDRPCVLLIVRALPDLNVCYLSQSPLTTRNYSLKRFSYP